MSRDGRGGKHSRNRCYATTKMPLKRKNLLRGQIFPEQPNFSAERAGKVCQELAAFERQSKSYMDMEQFDEKIFVPSHGFKFL